MTINVLPDYMSRNGLLAVAIVVFAGMLLLTVL